MENKKIPGSLTVFFPCFNDSQTIAGLVEQAARAASEISSDFEILVVDDGSTDGSAEILKKLSARLPFLKTIFHGKNLGYGGALRSGFKHAAGEFIFYTDGDGQYDPAELLKLAARMGEGVVLVNGYKTKRSDNFLRVAAGNLYSFAVKVLFRLPVRDPDCDFRLFRRAVLPADMDSFSGAICVELIQSLQKTGGRIEEVPILHYPRKHGSSQFFNFGSILRTFRELAVLKRKHGN